MKTMGSILLVALAGLAASAQMSNFVNQPTLTKPAVTGRYDNAIWSSVFVPPKDRHLSTQPWVNIGDPRAGQRIYGNPVTDETGLTLFSWGPRPKPDTRLNADRSLRE